MVKFSCYFFKIILPFQVLFNLYGAEHFFERFYYLRNYKYHNNKTAICRLVFLNLNNVIF